ncbi:YMGG-like glycine zipper-containing protein [Herminiimonas sp. NPDC097707]|uniref:YMGG-like glycine zipper-containing protein n=1 Tax=Herminiimonas sp. NPDC097707 TaxID=3364007 RepID=UPI00383B6FF8
MLHKKWIGIALLATAAVSTTAISTTAFADNRGVNTALGAVVGAVIGNSVGGQDAAIIGGVLGAVVGASASGHDDRYYGRRQAQVYYQPQPVYYQPAPVRARPYYRDGYGGRNDYRDRYQQDVRRVDYERYDRNQYRR